jgi:hypothetical protein
VAVPAAPAPAPIPRDAAWRAAAAAGDYASAFALLGDEGHARAVEHTRDPGVLLDLADVARAVRRKPLAIRALTRVLARHARDARAPLAALTLARLHLETPADAAAAVEALRRARQLGLPVALQEDALALQVEAHARAGQDAEARRFAEEYQRRFPSGRWRVTVERWTAPP